MFLNWKILPWNPKSRTCLNYLNFNKKKMFFPLLSAKLLSVVRVDTILSSQTLCVLNHKAMIYLIGRNYVLYHWLSIDPDCSSYWPHYGWVMLYTILRENCFSVTCPMVHIYQDLWAWSVQNGASKWELWISTILGQNVPFVAELRSPYLLSLMRYMYVYVCVYRST